jgi:hypothetical protein
MSIRCKFFLAFSILIALACSLALVGFRGIAMSGDLVVRLYDGPLMGINHARSADATLSEARILAAALLRRDKMIGGNPAGCVRGVRAMTFGLTVTTQNSAVRPTSLFSVAGAAASGRLQAIMVS